MINTKTRYVRLDAFRGFLAIGVVAYHSHLYPFFPWYWMSMDVFFVMSGFLITKSMISIKEKKRGATDFFIYRAVRLLPLFFIVLFSVELFIFICNQNLLFQSWSDKVESGFSLYYFFMLQNVDFILWGEKVFPRGIGLDHFWSLIIEEHFYVVIGLLFFYFYDSRFFSVKNILLISVCLILFSNVYRYYGGHWWTLPARLDGFVLGSVLGMYIFIEKFNFPISYKLKNFFIFIFAFSLTFTLFNIFNSYNIPYYDYINSSSRGVDIFFASLLSVFLIYNIFKRDIIHPEANGITKLFSLIGLFSFELYVIHYPIKYVIEKLLGGMMENCWSYNNSLINLSCNSLFFVLLLFISIPIAWLIHINITSPISNNRNKIIKNISLFFKKTGKA